MTNPAPRGPVRHWLALRAGGVALGAAIAGSAPGAEIVFPNALNGKPMETALRPGEPETAALKEFKSTGVNGYVGDAAAITQGKALYEQWCQVCHNADASGKMGPSLRGPTFVYPQTATDVGMFAVMYGGAFGAMQAFSRREITQDEMLKVIAYVRSLK